MRKHLWLVLALLLMGLPALAAQPMLLIESEFSREQVPTYWQRLNAFRTYFDLSYLDYTLLSSANFASGRGQGADLVVLPNNLVVTSSELQAIEGHLNAGGRLLVFGATGVRDEQGEEYPTSPLTPWLGVQPQQITGIAYLEILATDHPLFKGLPQRLVASTEQALGLIPQEGVSVLAQWVDSEGNPLGAAITETPAGVYLASDLTDSRVLNETTWAKPLIMNASHYLAPGAFGSAKNIGGMILGRIQNALAEAEKAYQETAKKFLDIHWAGAEAQMQKVRQVAATAQAAYDSLQFSELQAYSTQIQREAGILRASLVESKPVETRGIWISTSSIPTSPEGMRQMMETLAGAGFNAIFPEVLRLGATIWPSQVAENWGIMPQNPTYIGWDPLAVMVEEAHRVGLEIHLWFSMMYTGLNGPGAILAAYPQWMSVNRDGSTGYPRHGSTLYFASPVWDGLKEYLAQVMTEAATLYAVDGVHFDYIRFTGPDVTDTDYSVPTRELFKSLYGVDPINLSPGHELYWTWNAWRADHVTRLVAMATESVRSVRPDITVSAAITPNGFPSKTDRRYLQDWPRWAREGLIDLMIPMTYAPNPASAATWYSNPVRNNANKSFIVPGGQAYELPSPEIIVDQVTVLGHGSNSLGIVLFAHAHMNAQHYNLLINGPFSQPAVVGHRHHGQNLITLIQEAKRKADLYLAGGGITPQQAEFLVGYWDERLAEALSFIEEGSLQGYNSFIDGLSGMRRDARSAGITNPVLQILHDESVLLLNYTMQSQYHVVFVSRSEILGAIDELFTEARDLAMGLPPGHQHLVESILDQVLAGALRGEDRILLANEIDQLGQALTLFGRNREVDRTVARDVQQVLNRAILLLEWLK